MPQVTHSFGDFSAANPVAPQNWLASAWISPFNLSAAVWDSWLMLADNWCQMVFRPSHFHPHEHHSQLEVPDPILEDGEHDLFA